MGQSPPSSRYSSSPNGGIPFLQGTADFSAKSPTPLVYCDSPAKRAAPGDILLSVRAPVGELNLANQEVGIGRWLCAIRPQREMRFAWWALHEARQQLRAVSTGSTYDAVAIEDVGKLLVKTLSTSEERTAADYLDRETARLDALIAEKERLLQLLAEKRRALITRAVTRGLDPDAPLRDSGVPSFAQIPAHWKVTRLRFLSAAPSAYGANEAALEDDPAFPRFVRITDINEEGNLKSETFRSLDPALAEPYLLKEGDILFARSGATVGKAFLYKESWGPSCFAGYLVRMRCNTRLVKPAFIFTYAQSAPYWTQIREGTIQATIQNFSAERYGNLFFPLPPYQEQSDIVDELYDSLSYIDGLRSSIDSTIALVKERRSALVAAAVTGLLNIGSAA